MKAGICGFMSPETQNQETTFNLMKQSCCLNWIKKKATKPFLWNPIIKQQKEAIKLPPISEEETTLAQWQTSKILEPKPVLIQAQIKLTMHTKAFKCIPKLIA